MKDKTIKKILYLVIILFSTYYLLFNHIYMKINAKSSEIDDYTIEDIRHMIECENRLEVFSEDGSIELMESQVIDDTGIEQPDSSYLERTSFDEVKILDSGKPDNQSIVMTIMGDGFTSTEQAAFVNAATNVVHYLLGDDSAGTSGFYPYNLFKDYFTIYAIKVISEESGVSRDANTNNGHIVNNYFGSSFYYGNDTSTIQRALVITKKNKAQALEKPYSSITTIICNSSRWGGTGGDFAVISSNPNNGKILTHELGHTLGELADEYWYSGETFYTNERANKTNNGNINTNKWRQWIGMTGIYSGIGIYRYSSNPSDDAYNWFKPHENCHMQYSNNQFCAVCIEQLIKKWSKKPVPFLIQPI